MDEQIFQGFPKIARYSRQVIVTEKIDGTNAQIFITEDLQVLAGSRTRWITPENDNFGFARWVCEHEDELRALGPGRHFGEWWGQGIQRAYGLKEKRFSLFNVDQWGDAAVRPPCCHVVPELWRGSFEYLDVDYVMRCLYVDGSAAVPGFMRPEGIIIYHTHGNLAFKKTFEKDAAGKERS
ncbi:MAG: hypothetical protein M0Z43_02290 [Acidithiobacillus sp.]|nr:hypothetical protein [Acidithiobacillus sp.]